MSKSMYENRMLKANTVMIVIGTSLSLPLYAVAAGMPYEQLAAVQGKQKNGLVRTRWHWT
jgi:hypothetical protein